MIERKIANEILEQLSDYPAVALLGPRQIGKTTLAFIIGKQIPSVYLDMESPNDRDKLKDPETFLRTFEDKLVIIDEVHLIPGLFPVLRGLIDEGRRKGIESRRFLLLGSASLDLLKQSGESLAGRIAYIELPPIQANEIPFENVSKLWSRGGIPKSYLASSDEKSLLWRNNFIRTYLERDIPEFGFRIPPETMRRFWNMLAHTQSELFNAHMLSKSLSVSAPKVNGYLDLLVSLLLVRKLPPWLNNAGKRMIKSPKVFFVDSGIVHALLNIRDWQELMGHPIAGASWEAFVIENIIRVCPFGTLWSFFRTVAGAEIDLVLELPRNQGIWAIEIKLGLAPKLTKGFYNACEDIKPAKRFVVYSGNERYSIGNAVEVIGLQEMVKLLQSI